MDFPSLFNCKGQRVTKYTVH